MRLHQAVSQCRDRLFPRESFRFKTRKSPPADMSTLMAILRREVGTTSGQEHLQGETASDDLDPSLCFADRVNEVIRPLPRLSWCAGGAPTSVRAPRALNTVIRVQVLVKSPGDIAGKDFVLTRLKGCTVYLLDACGAVRADRLEDCKVYIGPVR